jgi:hypothetical protein
MCSSLSRKEKPTVTRAVSLATRWHIWDLRFSILDWRCDPRAHVMPCHNHYDLMAVATPGEGGLGYLQDNRKVSHGHENVAVRMERTPQPGHAVNLRVMPCGGNNKPNGQVLVGTKTRGPPTANVRATLAPVAAAPAMFWGAGPKQATIRALKTREGCMLWESCELKWICRSTDTFTFSRGKSYLLERNCRIEPRIEFLTHRI